ncbi:unnamed protein product, partial [Meganyctiphanes norvegica]
MPLDASNKRWFQAMKNVEDKKKKQGASSRYKNAARYDPRSSTYEISNEKLGIPCYSFFFYCDCGYGGGYGYPPPGGGGGAPPPPGGPAYGGMPPGIPGQQLFQDPMVANMAMQYGTNMAHQGKEFVEQKLEKYVSMTKVKYYFAVDTQYVLKKLQLLFFPFTHSDWSVHYEQEEPVQPRLEINAPDLYIPVMGVVTYVLVAGICLGLQDRFSPEGLGIQASSAVVWLVLEIVLILAIIYITSIKTNIGAWDLLAFSSYKYVGMIVSLLAGLIMETLGYYCVLGYSSLALLVFMFRSLRWQVQGSMDGYSAGNKRRLYLLLFITGIQPLMMWWLTKHLVGPRAVAMPPTMAQR